MTDAAETPTADPAALLAIFRHVASIQTFTAWTGLEVVSVTPGAVELAMANRDDFGQHHGYLHGALVGFLADTACAYAAATVVGDVVTAQYDLRFLAPGVGERFTARGEVVKASRRLVTTRADIFAHSGESEPKRIAIATATISRVEAKG